MLGGSAERKYSPEILVEGLVTGKLEVRHHPERHENCERSLRKKTTSAWVRLSLSEHETS